MNDKEENIQVVVRSRPLNSREKKKGEVCCVQATNNEKEVLLRLNEKEAQAFRCSRVFSGKTTQEQFFNSCGIINLLDSAVGGFRSCAFAYGQTGAGKTHTVVGSSSHLDCGGDGGGIIGRSLVYLFSKLSSLNVEYTVRISCLELYQEHIYDLLTDERDRSSLPLREHPTDGFFVEGCLIVPCSTVRAACKTIEKALRNRQIGSHDYNLRSNRSHFITEVFIDLPGQGAHLRGNNVENVPGMGGLYDDMEDDREYTVMGRMTFVDLAGSERLKDTKSSGKVLQEAGSINRSLYVLGKVIAGMSKSHGAQHKKEVPFRDSKLTKLLINSLGGVSRTMMISCVSESSGATNETLRTLKFSMSAARIRNRPVRFLDPQEKLIMELREEIKRLKFENKKLRVSLTTSEIQSPITSNMAMPKDIPNNDSDEKESSTIRLSKSTDSLNAKAKLSNDDIAASVSPTIDPDKYVPVLSQRDKAPASGVKKIKRNGSSSPRWKVPDLKPSGNGRRIVSDYDIHGRPLKQKVEMRSEKKAKPKKKKIGTTSAPQFHIKVGSGRPQIKKYDGPNPYLAHIKQKRNNMSRDKHGSKHPSSSSLPALTVPPPREKVSSAPSWKQEDDTYLPKISSKSPPVGSVRHRQQENNPTDQHAISSEELKSSVNSVRDKLTRMQAQLKAKRLDIERNPDKATPDKWASLEALEEEVQDMQLEVQISEQLQGLSQSLTMSNKLKDSDGAFTENKGQNASTSPVKNKTVEPDSNSPASVIRSHSPGRSSSTNESASDKDTDSSHVVGHGQNDSISRDKENTADLPNRRRGDYSRQSSGALSEYNSTCGSLKIVSEPSSPAVLHQTSHLYGEDLLTSPAASPTKESPTTHDEEAKPQGNQCETEEDEDDYAEDEYGDEDFDEEDYGDDDFEDD
mmetsp:Transcript_2699/g.4059  ORF Transcript_2699/g.4059 Transcript_2699/m.4059 type:complete len:912 (-) Transcript_2699:288-3023(-)|eukprot:CAMPEP_0185033652 /NCGR_PEP_ID=MMETSP1103-20130426/22799_1 /TAXON_ID=36769 /ORGANISM="Paraphysomonas bandaiensis, Strain Caron Lab Isolate" /LENGTH=911 /DNA_ID=CAMNT_0027570005 /DNA_START=122 /DNA_END=2857 /DNA_ORIENTATION=-